MTQNNGVFILKHTFIRCHDWQSFFTAYVSVYELEEPLTFNPALLRQTEHVGHISAVCFYVCHLITDLKQSVHVCFHLGTGRQLLIKSRL